MKPKIPELSKPDWARFYGDNRERLGPVTIRCGGSVSFKRHLGKPLSDNLWQDLIHRLTISGLCVYKADMSQSLVGRGSGHCTILLDESENVEDIQYCPRNPWRS